MFRTLQHIALDTADHLGFIVRLDPITVEREYLPGLERERRLEGLGT